MSRSRLASIAVAALVAMVAPQASAEPPAARSAEQQLGQYFYVDFPARLDSINNQIALAEAEVTLLARRVNQYRPMRSFGMYGATYFADQSAQLALLAAQQRVACLQGQKIALWRERQIVGEQLMESLP